MLRSKWENFGRYWISWAGINNLGMTTEALDLTVVTSEIVSKGVGRTLYGAVKSLG